MEYESRGLMISAPGKSSGKTTLTLGLTSALMHRGKKIRVFKKGPDYIDPMWHRVASGRTCHNIDPYWMDEELCRRAFFSRIHGMDLCLLEGNHGLHDGLDLEGGNSGAFLAKLLEIPVLLIVDSSGMNRGVAAIILGNQKLDPGVTIGGVVLNNVASIRQANKQVAAIEHYCGIPVIGTLPRSSDTGIKERHLGLVTIHESSDVQEVIGSLGRIINENCDLDKVMAIAGEIRTATLPEEKVATSSPPVRIGVAFDAAFCFYYQDNLDALRAAGAELVFFDTLKDRKLPADIKGLYIGGGFPESFLAELEENRSIREDILNRIESGLTTYAECGGLMYLTRSIERGGVRKKMVGALQADVLFQEKPVGKGYSELSDLSKNGWFKTDKVIKGHEFHYSRLIDVAPDLRFKFKINRGTGIDGKHDGIIYRNVIASYTHIHSLAVPDWAPSFVNAIRLT